MQQIISTEMKLRSEIASLTFTSSSVVTLLKTKTVFRMEAASEMGCLNIAKMKKSLWMLVILRKTIFKYIYSIDNAHLMYNAHPKLTNAN